MLLRLAALLVLSACATSVTPPLRPPEVRSDLGYHAGTVLTGPQAEPAAADRVSLDDSLTVLCRVRFAADIPLDELEPLASRTRLVISARGDEPLLPTAHLPGGAWLGSGSRARAFLGLLEGSGPDRSHRLFELRGVLPEGVTVTFHTELMEPVFRPSAGEVRRAMGFLVSREAGGGLTAALQVDSLDPETPPGAEQNVLERQIVLLEDAPVVGGDPLVIAIPSPVDPFGHNAFVVELSVGPPRHDGIQRAAIEECVAELRRAGERARDGAAPVDELESWRRSLRAGLQGLELAEHHRTGMVFLTTTNRAPMALDLALSADEATLAAWIAVFLSEVGDAPFTDAGREDLSWDLDRTAWRVLAERLEDEELSTGLQGVLALHAGEVGRFPGELIETLYRSPDRAAFEAALVAENRSFLSSLDPAARVRAFDWLRGRSAAPVGYDPLAPRRERRAALDRDGAGRDGERQ